MNIKPKRIDVSGIKIGQNNPFVLIAGPCVIESETQAINAAEELLGITQKAGVPFIFKASYDKANRTSVTSYRGPGLTKGLAILKKIKNELKIPIVSDVHAVSEVGYAQEVLDVIQIPAFLCRQTDLIVAVSKTKKVVNIKKGQFMSPWDMTHVIKKAESQGNDTLLLTERGASFGYNNLVSDFRSLSVLRSFGYPVVYDATHSIQLPGGCGGSSGGQKEFIPSLTRAALAVGVDAVFMEVHPDPENALSDAASMIKTAYLPDLLTQMKQIDSLVKSFD